MKKIISSFTLFFLSLTFSFGQSDFQKEFESSRQRFIDNPYQWFLTECTSNFQYITTVGNIVSLEQLSKQFIDKKVLQRDFTDLTYRQIENTVIVTGYLTHKYSQISNGLITDYGKEVITYTYINDKGKWKLASAHHSLNITPFTEAIFKELMGEYEIDPIVFFTKNCTKDFFSVGTLGELKDLDGIKEIFRTLKCEKEEFKHIKIRQYKNFAIVTGHLSAHFKKTDGTSFVQNNGFTHYFNFQEGQWKMAGFQHSALDSSKH